MLKGMFEWVATSVYAPATVNNKAAFWQELSQVAGMWNFPWLEGISMLFVIRMKRDGVCYYSDNEGFQ